MPATRPVTDCIFPEKTTVSFTAKVLVPDILAFPAAIEQETFTPFPTYPTRGTPQKSTKGGNFFEICLV